MNQHSQYTTDRLENACRERDRLRHFSCLVKISLAALATLLIVASLDYWLLLPLELRAAGQALLLGLAGFGAFRVVKIWRQPTGVKQAALDLESSRPELSCVISTAAEYLGGQRKASREYEPELVEALQTQAAKRLLVVETPYRRRMVRTAAILACGAGVAALFLALVPRAWTAWQRVLAPWSGSSYTRVEVKPGDAEVPEGSDLEIRSAFSGRLPKEAQLLWRDETQPSWQKTILTKSGQGQYSHALRNLAGTVRYRVGGSDALSPEYQVRTFVPPEISSLKIRIDYPAYTRLEPAEESSPDLSVVRGSSLKFRMAAKGNVSQARLRFANSPPLMLQAGADRTWNAELKALQDTAYWVELIDDAGRKGGNEKPYRITVLPDDPPHVQFVEPGRDVRADRADRVPLKISVTDDFGVEEVKLVFRKMNGSESVRVCAQAKPGRKELSADAEIDLAPLQLGDYELVSYYAEARDDNRLDGPGVGKSPVYFIEITTKSQALSQCNGGGQKINLLEIEKQIIAATTLVKPGDPEARMRDLAALQRQTIQYAEVFKASFILSISPPEARQEFDAATEAMEKAAQFLEGQNRDSALASEEKALAHLYQTVRLLPELEAGMCRSQGDCIKIVLEAIEKLKEQRKQDLAESLPRIIRDAKQLADRQTQLNSTLGRLPSAATQGAPQASESAAERSDERRGPGEGDSKLAAGEQRRLSEAAADLEAKLRALAGKDPRITHHFAQKMSVVSRQWHLAYEALANRDPKGAGISGPYGLGVLAELIGQLEQLWFAETRPSDLAAEDYPKEYETLISEYLKKLSYAE